MSVCLRRCSWLCTIFWKLLVAVRTWPMTNLTHLNKITASIHIIIHPSSSSLIPPLLFSFKKHCQRHNGPGGWVVLTKVTSLGHITSSYPNLDQTSLESWLSTNFKPIQTSAFRQNLNLKILTKYNFRILTTTELHNHNQVSVAK